MNALEAMCLLYGFFAACLFFCLWFAIRRKSRPSYLIAALSALAIVATSLVSIWIEGLSPGGLISTAVATMKPRPILAGFAGASAMIAAVMLFASVSPKENNPTAGTIWHRLACVATTVGAFLGVSFAIVLLAWDQVYDIQLTRPRVLSPTLSIRKVADLPTPPVRIAAGPSGSFYISSYTTDDVGRYGGIIQRYKLDSRNQMFASKTAASSHALYRPFGLACGGDDLYVSRSGHAAWARNGTIVDQSCGAVTCMKDFDGDGYFEYFDDIVADLPGAGGPDTMHQNNGIAIHGDTLFIAIGMNSDRELDERKYSGSILKLDLETGALDVYAEGFRNPFGIAVSEEGAVFVTDNDSSENAGDELNFVAPGEHYGHPYLEGSDETIEAKGFRQPLLMSDPDSNFTGLAFANGKSIPADLRGRLLLCDFGNGQVLSIALKREGDQYICTDKRVLAYIHSPVDICVDSDGVIYVASRYYKAVYAITPKSE